MQLSLEQLKLLDDEHRAKYMALERLFDSTGWKVFLEYIAATREAAHQKTQNAGSWDEYLCARTGQQVLDMILRAEQDMEAVYTQLADFIASQTEEADVFEELQHE